MEDGFAKSVAALRGRYPELARELSAFDSLEGILGWVRSRGGNIADIEVIPQDEYSHDVVVEASPGLFLAFEAT